MKRENEIITAKEFSRRFFLQLQLGDKIIDGYAKKHGLNFLSFLVLEYIYENPEHCTQKKIVEGILSPKQSVNLVVKSFWEKGFLELREMPEDRRNKEILLTKSGKAYAEKILSPIYKADEEAIEHMTAEERQIILKALGEYAEKFRKNLLMSERND